MIALIKQKDNKVVQKINFPSIDWVIEQLSENVCRVFFRKKVNGQFRSLDCTRNLKLLPRRYKVGYRNGIENPHGYDNIIPVWDINDRNWKSFDYNSVYSITVLLGEIK